MFFQNHCRSLRRRRSWEQTRGRKKQIQYPQELGRTRNKEGIQRVWSRVTREGWRQNFIVTFQENNSAPRKLSDWLKRNWVQWWHFEKLSVKIGSYEIFITFLRTETKELYFIVERSWSLQNSFFTATLEKRRPRDIEKVHKNSLLAQHLNLHQIEKRNKNIDLLYKLSVKVL